MTIKSILEECSMAEVWDNQTFGTVNMLKYNITKNLKCQFSTKWKNELHNMISCDVYVHSKPNFKMEKYLICLNKNQCIAICKFRTNNTCLPKVTGMCHVMSCYVISMLSMVYHWYSCVWCLIHLCMVYIQMCIQCLNWLKADVKTGVL